MNPTNNETAVSQTNASGKLAKPKGKTKSVFPKVILGVLCVIIAYQLELFDSAIQYIKFDSTPVPVDKVLDIENSSDKQALESKIDERRSITSNEAPPIITSTTFDQLQALYLMRSRLDETIKSAAELYGMQRINIHNKREQVKEYDLAASISQSNLTIAKSEDEIKKLKAEAGVTQKEVKTADNRLVIPSSTEITQTDVAPSQKDVFNQPGSSVYGTGSNDLNFDSMGGKFKISKNNVRVSLIVERNDSKTAVFNINGRDLKNVKEGQVIANQFKVLNLDPSLGCSELNDLENKENFITCAN